MNAMISPIIRRAILDLLTDIGGDHNHEELTLLLRNLGHRVSFSSVAGELHTLGEWGFLRAQNVGAYTVASITPDGRDIADGMMVHEGISKFKTGN